MEVFFQSLKNCAFGQTSVTTIGDKKIKMLNWGTLQEISPTKNLAENLYPGYLAYKYQNNLEGKLIEMVGSIIISDGVIIEDVTDDVKNSMLMDPSFQLEIAKQLYGAHIAYPIINTIVDSKEANKRFEFGLLPFENVRLCNTGVAQKDEQIIVQDYAFGFDYNSKNCLNEKNVNKKLISYKEYLKGKDDKSSYWLPVWNKDEPIQGLSAVVLKLNNIQQNKYPSIDHQKQEFQHAFQVIKCYMEIASRHASGGMHIDGLVRVYLAGGNAVQAPSLLSQSPLPDNQKIFNDISQKFKDTVKGSANSANVIIQKYPATQEHPHGTFELEMFDKAKSDEFLKENLKVAFDIICMAHNITDRARFGLESTQNNLKDSAEILRHKNALYQKTLTKYRRAIVEFYKKVLTDIYGIENPIVKIEPEEYNIIGFTDLMKILTPNEMREIINYEPLDIQDEL